MKYLAQTKGIGRKKKKKISNILKESCYYLNVSILEFLNAKHLVMRPIYTTLVRLHIERYRNIDYKEKFRDMDTRDMNTQVHMTRKI